MIVATREDIAEQLWLRDEQELAVAMLDCDAATHRRVMERSTAWRWSSLRHDTIDELLVAGAVEVLDGKRNKPRRWQPRSEDTLAAFWDLVGPERDRRTPDDPAGQVLGLLGDELGGNAP
ncbi:hypothetical protein [Modestobacter sp. VKM Ac-2978]|uniref:hypothetical protein n=1 Tax=Modestobacter sp. VKM Ac-2978 TaxID=3004132 RepID=UPI0022AA1042|nr:hypothetical protein [Modestobacter sp. VKM Ac-2978]MCZ2849323.1 hypothetical protein [Modestobacter sp. VKM Ac-2978]